MQQDQDVEKEITKLEKKFVRDGRESLVRELRNLPNDQKRERLKQQAILMQEIIDNKAKAAGETKTKSAIDQVKEHNSMFREQMDGAKRISRLIYLLIEESGKI